MHVYVGPESLDSQDPRTVLAEFAVARDSQPDLSYSTYTAESGLTVTEARYESTSGPSWMWSSFAVGSGGVVVIRMAALDGEMADWLRPAYELALESVAVTD